MLMSYYFNFTKFYGDLLCPKNCSHKLRKNIVKILKLSVGKRNGQDKEHIKVFLFFLNVAQFIDINTRESALNNVCQGIFFLVC